MDNQGNTRFKDFEPAKIEVKELEMRTKNEGNEMIIDRFILDTSAGKIEHLPYIKVKETEIEGMTVTNKRKATIHEIPKEMKKINELLRSEGSCVITCAYFARIEGEKVGLYIRTEDLDGMKIMKKTKKDDEIFTLDDIEVDEDLEKV